MKITGWTDFWDVRFEDAAKAGVSEFREMREVIKKEIKEKGYKICGYSHQNGYAPVIDNKWLFSVTFRSWGRIMQEAYDLPDEDGFGYCIWAWSKPSGEKEVLPRRENDEQSSNSN